MKRVERVMVPMGAESPMAVAKYVAGLVRRTPATLGSGASLEQGQRDYRRACASCHGDQATAQVARGMSALAGQHAPYLIRKMREGGGRQHGALFKRLSAAEQAAIADYLARLPAPMPEV